MTLFGYRINVPNHRSKALFVVVNVCSQRDDCRSSNYPINILYNFGRGQPRALQYHL